MSTNLEAFQALLARMRGEFLAELPERCDRLDELILTLEKAPDERDAFAELYRGVHSLKGSGGTHGLSIITTLCHQLENHLTETDAKRGFGTAFASRALAYVDLMRRVELIAQQASPNYSAIEADLEALRQTGLQSRKTGLIAESSPMMAALYQQALGEMPLQLTLVDNGLAALERLLQEHYDFVIVGREVRELNGIAMIVALRSSQVRNQNIPAILVSSKLDSVPDYAGFGATILRDKNMADNLVAAVQAVLPK
jgi:chemotaxis protein histidine kinase CheA